MLVTEGKQLIRDFLIILQTYKSSGSAERATKFFTYYSTVNEFMMKVRTLVASRKKPRRLELNNNLVRFNEKTVEPVCYPQCFEGIIASYADRYAVTENAAILAEWAKTGKHLRV